MQVPRQGFPFGKKDFPDKKADPFRRDEKEGQALSKVPTKARNELCISQVLLGKQVILTMPHVALVPGLFSGGAFLGPIQSTRVCDVLDFRILEDA